MLNESWIGWMASYKEFRLAVTDWQQSNVCRKLVNDLNDVEENYTGVIQINIVIVTTDHLVIYKECC